MRRKAAAIAATVATLAAAGCGNDEPAGAVPPPAPAEYTEQEVLDHAQITPNDGGISYTHEPSGCHLAVVLIGEDNVELYAAAGDNVASNPDRTVGVKITDPREQECHAALTKALADL